MHTTKNVFMKFEVLLRHEHRIPELIRGLIEGVFSAGWKTTAFGIKKSLSRRKEKLRSVHSS